MTENGLLRAYNRIQGFIPDPTFRSEEKFQTHAPVKAVVNKEDFARSPNYLSMHLGEHHAIAGATGTGKTYYTLKGLLPYLHSLYPHVKRYLLDSTSDPDILRHVPHALQHSGNDPPPLLHSAAYVQVWTPDNSKIPKQYAHWFDRLNDTHEPAIVVIDEVASMTREAVDSLETLLKQFRKHKGTVICLTQQIAKVDTTVFSQLTHFCQFDIGSEVYDLARARKILALAKEEHHTPRHEHGFWYRRVRGNYPAREYNSMKEMFSHGKNF